MKATTITIGDEILIGQTIDTNSAWIGQQLSYIGIQQQEIYTVSDETSAIISALERAEQRSDIVIITGGLGPTSDDITKPTLATYFDSHLEFKQDLYDHIEAYYTSRGRAVNPQAKKLAEIPANGIYFLNQKGTAAGMQFERNNTLFFSVPGVPQEMKHLMDEFILPFLKEKNSGKTIIHKTIMTAGTGESSIEKSIAHIVKTFPAHISIAYLPSLGTVKVRISGVSENEENLRDLVTEYGKQIIENIENNVFASEDVSLESVVGEMLVEKNATISFAESCTGGYIAHRVTSVPGSSRYFEGAIVAYSYDIKEKMLGVKHNTLLQHGAVSEECVIEMAAGCRGKFGSDYAIAVSGIAGPEGGLPGKPVGTVWMAIADHTGVHSKLFQLTPHRDFNIPLTSNLTLNELRKRILKNNRVVK